VIFHGHAYDFRRYFTLRHAYPLAVGIDHLFKYYNGMGHEEASRQSRDTQAAGAATSDS
jgi:hypothetical protein